MSGKLYYWVANWNLSRAQAQQLLGGDVADMVDTTSSSLDAVIQCYPSIKRFAAYITGTPDIRYTVDQLNRIRALGDVALLEIDQSNLDLPLLSHVKVAKDDESGASTTAEAVHVASERIGRGDDYIIYCDQAILADVEHAATVAGLPHGKIIAYQWASPTSNPDTPLPGTRLTLKEANADLSVIIPAYLPLPMLAPAGTFNAHISVDSGGKWNAEPAPGNVILGGPDEYWEAKVGVNRSTGKWRIGPLPAEK